MLKLNLSNKYKKILKFHHYGIAVKSFNESIKFYKMLGYKNTKIIKDNAQNIHLVLLIKKNFPTIELVKASGKNNPISNFLKFTDVSMYHTCYEVKKKNFNFKVFLKNFDSICVGTPIPNKIFKKKFTRFYYIKNVGLLEFLHN